MNGTKGNALKSKTFATACLAAIVYMAPRASPCDTLPPSNGMPLRTVYTPNPTNDEDSPEQAGVLEQWNESGTTRSSMDQVVKNLEGPKENHAVQKIGRYADGSKASQETTITSSLPGKRLLYAGIDHWTRSGKLKSTSRQVDTLDPNGVEIKGERKTVIFRHERVISEKQEKWDPDFHGWLETYDRTTLYYDNGDLKQRITMRPPENTKTKEAWGSHGEKTSQKWNEKKQIWIAL